MRTCGRFKEFDKRVFQVKTEENKACKTEEKSGLSQHEREQLRTGMKATPQQRLTWLEEALQLAAKTKS